MLIPCLEAPAALHPAEDGGGARGSGDSPPSAQTNFRKAEQGDLAKAHQVGPGWMSLHRYGARPSYHIPLAECDRGDEEQPRRGSGSQGGSLHLHSRARSRRLTLLLIFS